MSIFKKLKTVTKAMNVSKGGKNAYMNYEYYTLDNILDALEVACDEVELYIHQQILTDVTPTGALISSVITTAHDLESGESLELGNIKFEMLKDPQKSGACITYYRRYALVSALGVKGEKDLDGLTPGEFKAGKKDPATLQAQSVAPIDQLAELLKSNLTDTQHKKVEEMKVLAKQKYNADKFSELNETQITTIINIIKKA